MPIAGRTVAAFIAGSGGMSDANMGRDKPVDLNNELGRILDKYEEYTDVLIGLAFLREPFAGDFRAFIGLKDDAAFVRAFEAFMAIAHDTFRWRDYLDARTTAERTFRLFFERQR